MSHKTCENPPFGVKVFKAADTTPAAVGGSPQKALQEIILYCKRWLMADLKNTCLLNYNLLQLCGIGKQSALLHLAKVFFYI